MTDTIDQLAWEIAGNAYFSSDHLLGYGKECAHLALRRGIQLERDRCAAIAKDYRENAGGSESYRRACEHIETTIRSQGE